MWTLGPEHPDYGRAVASPTALASDPPGSYAALGRHLWQEQRPNAWGGWHGEACACLACADARVARPLVLVGKRHLDPPKRGRSRAKPRETARPCGRCGQMIEYGQQCAACRERVQQRHRGRAS